MKAFDQWTVMPHGPIEKLNERVWRIEGSLPKMPLKRVLTVVRRANGELVLHNPIALAPEAMAELEAWGRPAFLIVPNPYHRLDAPVFQARYPEARLLCPAGARARVEQVARVDGSYRDFPADPDVTFEHLEGVGETEGVVTVRASDGVTLILNDSVFNQPHLPGWFGRIYRLIGSSGGPKVPWLVRMAMVKDKALLRKNLEQLAATPELRRVIVSHVDVIDRTPAETLRQVAARL